MTRQTPRQKTAKFFFALAHPRRLKIIETLREHPKGLTYEHLGLDTGLPDASLSHHLRFINEAGLIERKVKNRNSIYRLNAGMLDGIMPASALQKAA